MEWDKASTSLFYVSWILGPPPSFTALCLEYNLDCFFPMYQCILILSFSHFSFEAICGGSLNFLHILSKRDALHVDVDPKQRASYKIAIT